MFFYIRTKTKIETFLKIIPCDKIAKEKSLKNYFKSKTFVTINCHNKVEKS